ncbi:MAG: hypothetical protein KGJ60_16140 [Verrucomicrobiota bacterium]|nr:hypothetical protein [Verrucomicrobiota bacterium]
MKSAKINKSSLIGLPTAFYGRFAARNPGPTTQNRGWRLKTTAKRASASTLSAEKQRSVCQSDHFENPPLQHDRRNGQVT